MAKSFKQIQRDSIVYSLPAECKKNKEGIKHWLSSLRIECQKGKALEVVESE